MIHLVSIHAPAKGATKYALLHDISEKVSIHAPAKGATIVTQIGLLGLQSFNPRSREGSDSPRYGTMMLDRGFNPRSREGSDKISDFFTFDPSGFNPRSREGSDGFIV